MSVRTPTLRMSGIGAYSGVMVQYRDDATAATRWQQLEIGNATGRVECQNDSGVHGDGTAGAGLCPGWKRFA